MNKEIISVGLAGILAGALLVVIFGRVPSLKPNIGAPGSGTGYEAVADREFMDQMLASHQMAINLADEAIAQAERQEVKDLATSVKVSQTAEMDQLRAWYRAWFGVAAPEFVRMGSGMIEQGMMGMMMSDKSVFGELASSDPFDKKFLEQMISNGQTAIVKASRAAARPGRGEIRIFARSVVDTQVAQVKEMRGWYDSWYGKGNKRIATGQ